MVDRNESILKNIKDIQSLRGLLKSEMSINDPVDGEVIATIKVYNDAPESPDGGDIVFLGVGLRITVGSERGSQRGSNYWPSRIKKSRPSEKIELRQKYNEGTWVGGTDNSFPAATADEQSHGEVLFPGEIVVYEIKISESDLPYLDVRVEGSVSRRHLFHISQPMETLKKWSQPLLVQTFQDLDRIDLYSPLVSLVDVIPAFSPQTTLADLEAFRQQIEKGVEHAKKVMPELNKVYHSAPNQELRDLMKQHIGKYITTSERICNRVLETLSGSDTGRMKEATEELKAHLLTLDEVKKAKVKLMSKFGIKP